MHELGIDGAALGADTTLVFAIWDPGERSLHADRAGHGAQAELGWFRSCGRGVFECDGDVYGAGLGCDGEEVVEGVGPSHGAGGDVDDRLPRA